MVNNVIYQGRLTADPELKKTQSGVCLVEFTLAWNNKYKDTETNCFLRCKAWRNTAEFISNYFSKGKEMLVEGSLETNEWTDESGQNRSRTLLTVNKAHFCGGKQSDSQTNKDVSTTSEPDPIDGEADDDCPF